ncbi:hypothetical protein BH11VER1_BH11VER1_06570 [soil metagenome]
MIRTQIQLPDEVFARAKKLCEAREISFAELSRRGIEYILSVYTQHPDSKDVWLPPKPRRLGWRGLTDTEIKAQAQLTETELSLSHRLQK